MSSKATSIKSAVAAFMVEHGISGEMEQNLLKEAIHLHLLSALSDAGILRHVVFRGGTALRLCYGGGSQPRELLFFVRKIRTPFAQRKLLKNEYHPTGKSEDPATRAFSL